MNPGMDGASTASSTCLSDLRLDRWLTGECTGDEVARYQQHLAGCPGCTARVAAIRRFSTRQRTRLPAFAELQAEAEAEADTNTDTENGDGARPGSRPIRWRSRIWMAAPLLAAAVALSWLAPRLRDRGPAVVPEVPSQSRPGASSDGQTRRKGTAHLRAYVLRNGDMFPMISGDVVHPGDALQLTYSVSEAMYLAVVGRDGGGNVSIFFASNERSAPISAGADQTLPDSIVLDDILGQEVFHALFCTRPVDIRPVLDALAAGVPGLSPPPSCRVQSLTLDKRP